MAVININFFAKIAKTNPMVKQAFKWTVNFTLHLLEAQRLIDYRKVQAASIDWERGNLDLGDSFTEQLFARSVNEYVVNRQKKKWEFSDYAKIKKDSELKNPNT